MLYLIIYLFEISMRLLDYQRIFTDFRAQINDNQLPAVGFVYIFRLFTDKYLLVASSNVLSVCHAAFAALYGRLQAFTANTVQLSMICMKL